MKMDQGTYLDAVNIENFENQHNLKILPNPTV